MRGELAPKTVVIGALPLYHVYGITSVLNVSMYLGLTIELFSQFEPEKGCIGHGDKISYWCRCPDNLCPNHVIITANTSAIPITDIVETEGLPR